MIKDVPIGRLIRGNKFSLDNGCTVFTVIKIAPSIRGEDFLYITIRTPLNNILYGNLLKISIVMATNIIRFGR